MAVHEPRTPAEHLLGSRARARVLAALLLGPGTVSELARASGCAKSATSAALRQLAAAGMVEASGDRFAMAEQNRDLAAGITSLEPPESQRDLLRAYIGKWVALSREGEVVGSDEDPCALARWANEHAVDAYEFVLVQDPSVPPTPEQLMWSTW